MKISKVICIALCLCLSFMPLTFVEAQETEQTKQMIIYITTDTGETIPITIEMAPEEVDLEGLDIEAIQEGLNTDELIGSIFGRQTEPTIVYPITKADEPNFVNDEYLFSNAMFGAAVANGRQSVDEYFERLEMYDVPYESVEINQDTTTVFFSEHYYVSIKCIDNNMICDFHIVNQGKEFILPLYTQWHNEEEIFTLIQQKHPLQTASMEQLNDLIQTNWNFSQFEPSNVCDHVFSAMLEASTAWYGMSFDDYIKIKNTHFKHSVITDNDEVYHWCSYDCETSGMLLDIAHYFTDGTLSSIAIQLDPPDSFESSSYGTWTEIRCPMLFIDLSRTWVSEYIR